MGAKPQHRRGAAKLRLRGDIKIVGKGTEFIGEYVPDDRIAALKEELLIPEDKKILLYFGTLSQKKNVRLVIDTMLELKETGDEYIRFRWAEDRTRNT